MKAKETIPNCKLSSRELRHRKATVIAGLKGLVLEKYETSGGFKYGFDSSDQTFGLLCEFIRTERLCCDFFTFSLTISDRESPVWLELSGPEGTKEFIGHEIGF